MSRMASRGGLGRRLDAFRRRVAAVPFGLRLFLILAIALGIVGVVAYSLLSDRLEQHQTDVIAGEQQADAAGAEAIMSGSPRPDAIKEIDEQLDAIGNRPGTTEASLVGPTGVILASDNNSLVGESDF